ncbi:MAG: nucleoside-diphosphate kinase [Patescibacteria group bacterium]
MKNEKSLVIIKPDGIQRSLVGEIIKRYERSGLKLIGLKIIVPTKDLIEKHYLLDPNWKRNVGEKAINSYKKQGKKPPSEDPIDVGNTVVEGLKKYLTAGPVIVMVWSGAHAVGIIRKITGGTEPLTSDVGTIRGDYTIDSYELSDIGGRAIRNLIHASGTPEEVDNEINLWFKKEELINYRLINEEIIYDVNLDRILE